MFRARQKPGRPKKDKSEVRSCSIHLRLTEDEYAHVKFAAQYVHDYDRISDYARDKLLDNLKERLGD